jgi:hypothetical protein
MMWPTFITRPFQEVDPLVETAMHYQTRMWLQPEAQWKGTSGSAVGTCLKAHDGLDERVTAGELGSLDGDSGYIPGFHMETKVGLFDPVKLTLKAPGTTRFKLGYDELLSNFASKFNLHRCTKVSAIGRYVLHVFRTCDSAAGDCNEVGWCRLTL